MILYPAIDLKGGQCVRLLHGDMTKATVFSDSPADQAAAFAAAGFPWLHVVDLDGAIEGRAVNAPAVKAILNRISLPVQLGGGVRTLEAIEAWLTAGVSPPPWRGTIWPGSSSTRRRARPQASP